MGKLTAGACSVLEAGPELTRDAMELQFRDVPCLLHGTDRS